VRQHARCQALMLLLLAGCASEAPKNIDISDPPTAPAPASPHPAETGALKAADIMRALAGNTFRYTRGANTGIISFVSDGTFTYKESGKGEGSGIWQASAGQLCQAFNPSPFLPKGSRSVCYPFSRKGEAYTAGATRYAPS
jgi:hypothetical protein